MKLGKWSTTAASNNSTPPDGAPDGQAASTFNDCMRESMAAIRTVFNDAQYFDQALTPTFATSTSFTLAGDQTSAVHAGRRLKLIDYTVNYATVVTASFTAVTTVHLSMDSGSVTAALSAFALSIFSKNNQSVPIPDSASVGAVNVSGAMTAGNLTVGNFSLSISSTSTAKAWVGFHYSSGAGTVIVHSSYNVSSVSRSAVGVYRINFTTPMSDILYWQNWGSGGRYRIAPTSILTTSYKFSVRIVDTPPGSVTDPNSQSLNLVFFR